MWLQLTSIPTQVINENCYVSTFHFKLNCLIVMYSNLVIIVKRNSHLLSTEVAKDKV